LNTLFLFDIEKIEYLEVAIPKPYAGDKVICFVVQGRAVAQVQVQGLEMDLDQPLLGSLDLNSLSSLIISQHI
jgi:hypothetical protein